jgi:two-component system cell cycle response regulator
LPPLIKPTKIHTSTAAKVILRIALIVGILESLIMLFFSASGIGHSGLLGFILDPVLLVVLTTPPLYFFVVRPYILDREQQHALVEFLAHHDELTRLCNRRMLDEHLKRCLPALARQGDFGALIYLDLDGFKPINDEYGHEIGDRVLVEIGSRLSTSLRSEEISARVGGDEFVLLIPNAGQDKTQATRQAAVLADRIQGLIREPMQIQGVILQVGCSIGVHILTPETQNASLAIKAADMAMYQAKHAELGSIVFSDSLHKPSYNIVNIGVMEIDHQHQQIDQLLGSLFEPDSDRVQGLKTLLEMVSHHFVSEVDISARLGLNMTKEHILDHTYLLKLLKEIKPSDNEPEFLEQLVSIGRLLENHVLEYDRSLAVEKDEVEKDVDSNLVQIEASTSGLGRSN